MIDYIKDDITNTDCNYIVHGCNAQGVMGSGVAKVLYNKWPLVRDYYMEQACVWSELELGSVQKVEVEKGKWVLNAITQRYFGRGGHKYVSYDAMDACMQKVRLMTKEDEMIAMPKIGAGLGGGNWDIIETIIRVNLYDRNVTIYEI